MACRARPPRAAKGSRLGAAGDAFPAGRGQGRRALQPAVGSPSRSRSNRTSGSAARRAGAWSNTFGAARVRLRACDRVELDRVHQHGARRTVFVGTSPRVDRLARLESPAADAEAAEVQAPTRRRPEASSAAAPVTAATPATAWSQPASTSSTTRRAATCSAASTTSGRRRDQTGLGKGRPEPRPQRPSRPLAAQGPGQSEE